MSREASSIAEVARRVNCHQQAVEGGGGTVSYVLRWG